MMWGHLVPISPFTTQCDKSTNDNKTGGIRNKDIHSNHTLKPLQVPGSIGREELLRPFCNVCPTCNSSNCGNKKKSTSPKKKRIKTATLCNICKSIHDIAKFIPRKDFWCFTYNESSSSDNNNDSEKKKKKMLQLIITGKNVSQLVRIQSSNGVIRQLDHKKDVQTIQIHDNDILSLLWYNVQQQQKSSRSSDIKSKSKKLETMVQFRLTMDKCDDASCQNDRNNCGEVLPPASILVDDIGKANNDTTVKLQNNDNQNMTSNAKIHTNESRDDNDSSLKIDDGGTNNKGCMKKSSEPFKVGQSGEEKKQPPPCPDREKKDTSKDDSSSSSSSSSDDEHLWSAGIKFKPAKKEKVARGNYFRNVRAKYGDNRNSVAKKPGGIQGSKKSLPNSLPADAHIECVKSSSKDEYDSSAPLTIPDQYQFVASCESKSHSFDTAEKSPSQQPTKKSEGNNLSTPQKSNQRGKRSHTDIQSAEDLEKEASKTPKKSNLRSEDNTSPSNVLLSSLSHDELVKLHKQSTPQNSDDKPSLRHTVLSLTLALTSNASAYDSNFVRECTNAETTAKKGGMLKNNERMQNEKQSWMPRLLQGTKINLQQERED